MSGHPRMQLHGGPISPFVRKVSLCILEKRIGPLVEPVRSPTAMLEPNRTLMLHNPLSKIPTLITEAGQVLFDSDVICDYLDFRFPDPPLLPPPENSWQVRCWNSLASGALEVLVLWRFECNRPAAQQSAQLLQSYAEKMHAVLDRVEAEFENLETVEFGLAHITMGCLFGYLDFRFAEFDWRIRHPHSAAWFEGFMQRPAAMCTIPYEGDQPPVAAHFWK